MYRIRIQQAFPPSPSSTGTHSTRAINTKRPSPSACPTRDSRSSFLSTTQRPAGKTGPSSFRFPCYVFLRTGGREWLPVLTTPGVHMVASYAGQPAAIPPGEIEAIRRALESSKHVDPHPFVKTGDWVRVRSGSLAGIEGTLVRKKN